MRRSGLGYAHDIVKSKIFCNYRAPAICAELDLSHAPKNNYIVTVGATVLFRDLVLLKLGLFLSPLRGKARSTRGVRV